MSGNYSLKSFLRKSQNKDLERYFQTNGIEIPVDWEKLKEAKIDPIADTIENLDDKARQRIESDFLAIHALNNEAGYQALRQELGQEKSSVIDDMDFINAAFLCFFDHKDTFDMARVFQPFFDTGRYWRKVQNVLGKLPTDPAQHTKRLAECLSAYFKNHEGRGRNCQVEHYRRGSRHFFFAFPEDHPTHLIQWVRSEMQKTHVNPAFEVVFVYDTETCSLDTHYEGSAQNGKFLDNVFAQTILGQEIPEHLYNKPVYALNKLKDKKFKFVTQPQDRIERITVCKLRYDLRIRRGSKFRIEANVFGDTGQDALYAEAEQLFGMPGQAKNDKIPYEFLDISWAEIAVDFRSEARKGYKRRRFTISAPNSCTLKHEGEDQIIRRILKDSSIELPPANDAAENDTNRQAA